LASESELDDLFGSLSFSRQLLEEKLPEWLALESQARALVQRGRVENLGWTEDHDGGRLPLISFTFGNTDPKAPVLGLYGGVHGLERIGAQVVLSLLGSFSDLLLWDRLLHEALSQIRIVFFPMVNPLGILHRTRSNPNGVDLMCNAPVESDENPTWLVGGQRFSPKISWYRGNPDRLEPESQALVDLTRRETFGSSRVVTLDFHSGFGTVDQIWFPYAKSRKPFPHLPELHALKEAFERTHPHHFYKIEPQAKNYTTHGDLWDYLYDHYREKNPGGVFLPLAVEMGSWMWVKKNPVQLFTALGRYNPMVPHRHKRILRRHNTLFDFLIRTLVSNSWVPILNEQREKHRARALQLWYEE
jgi:hypothetical protein